MMIASEIALSTIPRWLQYHYIRFPDQPLAPLAEYGQAAVLSVNIAGLIPLIEQLTIDAHNDVSQVTQLLTFYFGQLMQVITEHGGELAEFTGDSFVIMWHVGSLGKELITLTRRAAQCGLALIDRQIALSEQNKLFTSITLRIVLKAGNIWTATIGGTHNQWTFITAGSVFHSLDINQTPVVVHAVIVAPESWHLLSNYCKGTPLEQHYVHLQSITSPLKPRSLLPLPLTTEVLSSLSHYFALNTKVDNLKNFLSPHCTILCVGIKGFNYHKTTILLQLQDIFYDIQQLVYELGGHIIQPSIHQQDTIFTLIWGIPGYHYNNNILRAMQVAQRIQQIVVQHNLHSNIGISTGEVIGFRLTQTHPLTILGTTRQIATILMQKAKNAIGCDRATYQVAQVYFNFKQLSTLIFKGQTMKMYQPTGLMSQMIARRYERNCLIEQLENLQKQDERITVIVEGDTGIGKSCLINDLLSYVPALPVTCLVSHGDPYQETTPYYVWRSIFTQLFGHELPTEPEARRQRILAHLQSLPALLLTRLPLLNAILPLNLPENTITTQMHGKVRVDNINALLLALLHEMLKQSQNRYVLIFEDVDWLDSASWTLLRLVSQQIKPLLLILTVHPSHVPIPQSHQFLFKRAGTVLLHIEALKIEEVTVLLAQRLAVLQIPEEIVAFIIEKTNGHPLFSEQLLYALRDSGLLRIIDGQCHVSNLFQQYQYADLPENLAETIISRFIHLTSHLQHTLKIASIIGKHFTPTLLQVLYPIDLDIILAYLETLKKLEFIIYQPISEEFYFKSNHIQKTIYELIPATVTQQWHHQLAAWYETNATSQLSNYYPILTYHWLRSQDIKKTIEYLTLAGEQALDYCAYQEAVYFYQQLLQLAPKNAYFQLQLGKAYLGLDKIAESQQAFEQGLKLLKKSIPKTKFSLFFSTLWQATQQLLHRGLPRYFLAHQITPQDHHFVTAQLYEQLGNLWVNTGMSTLAVFHARLRTLNLAERTIPKQNNTQRGDSELLTRAYTQFSVLIGLFTLTKLESVYANRALENVDYITQLADSISIFETLGMRDASYGRWVSCQTHLIKAIKIAEHIGDIKGQMHCLYLLNLVHCCQGQFTDKIKQFNVLYVLARQYNDLLAQIWGLCGQTMVFLQMNQLDDAVNCLKIIQSLPSDQLDLPEAIWVCGLLTQVYFRQGSLAKAVQMATKTAHLIAKTTPTAFHLFESYATVAHIYLVQWENTPFLSTKEKHACNKLSKHACVILDDYADRFQMAKPRSWLLQGLHAWLNGHSKKAHQLWEKSLDRALDLSMLYEQALAHFEIARHVEHLTEQKVQQHLQKATEIFTQLDAQHYLQQIKELTNK